VALAAAVVLTAVACGETTTGSGTFGGSSVASNKPDPSALLGPEAKADKAPVKIGQISDGKSAASDQSYELDVVAATAQYLNEHKKGVAGHEIQIVTCVDDGEPSKTTDCANQLVSEKVVAVLGGELAHGENIFQPLHDAGIPVMYYAAGSAKVVLDKDASFILAAATGPLIDVPIAAAKAAGKDKVTVVVIDVPAATGIYETLGKKLFADAGIGLELVKVPVGTADMTPQMQALTATDPGDVHILGTDAFCISALNGLKAVGYDGPRSMIGQCLSDATRKAVPAADLAGIRVTATAPFGTDDQGVALYQAILDTYAQDKDVPSTKSGAVGIYMALSSLALVLEGQTADLTSPSIIAAIKAMPEKQIPASGGIGFRCNGKASSLAPAVCAKGSLLTILGDDGEPTTYETLSNTPIEG